MNPAPKTSDGTTNHTPMQHTGLPYKAPEQRNTQNAEELLYGQNVTIEELQTLIVQVRVNR